MRTDPQCVSYHQLTIMYLTEREGGREGGREGEESLKKGAASCLLNAASTIQVQTVYIHVHVCGICMFNVRVYYTFCSFSGATRASASVASSTKQYLYDIIHRDDDIITGVYSPYMSILVDE